MCERTKTITNERPFFDTHFPRVYLARSPPIALSPSKPFCDTLREHRLPLVSPRSRSRDTRPPIRLRRQRRRRGPVRIDFRTRQQHTRNVRQQHFGAPAQFRCTGPKNTQTRKGVLFGRKFASRRAVVYKEFIRPSGVRTQCWRPAKCTS